jgi:hypothetical protein
MLRHACGYKLANDGHVRARARRISAIATFRIRPAIPPWRRNGSRNFFEIESARIVVAWDFETLKNALEDIGFRNCTRRDFDPALDSERPRCFLDTLYVDCVRP